MARMHSDSASSSCSLVTALSTSEVGNRQASVWSSVQPEKAGSCHHLVPPAVFRAARPCEPCGEELLWDRQTLRKNLTHSSPQRFIQSNSLGTEGSPSQIHSFPLRCPKWPRFETRRNPSQPWLRARGQPAFMRLQSLPQIWLCFTTGPS